MEKYNIATAAAMQVFLLFSLIQPNLLVIAQNFDDIDSTYLKSVKDATKMPLEASYDYVVVGGGTAGCPLAATLSSKHKVLILERGGVPADNPGVFDANSIAANLMQEDNGRTPAEVFTSEDGVVSARGRVLGGSSMINAGFFSRGDGEFFGASGVDWDMDAVEESYRWVEERVAHRSDMLEWQYAVREALLEAGVGPDNGFSLDHLIGTKTSASTFDGLGRRHGAVQLLNKANLSNLEVVVYAYVEKIIFSSSKQGLAATGVKYTDSEGKLHVATIHKKGEIILSAGALGSPQLLLLSGIGPKPYLSSIKIQTLRHHPNVGKFVYDNPRNQITLTPPFTLNSSYLQIVGIMKHQFIEAISLPNPFSFPPPYGFLPVKSHPVDLNLAMIVMKISGPLSTGSYKLASPNDVKIAPKVRYNYFSHPRDLARCVDAMRTVGRMLKTKSMDKYKFADSRGRKEFKYLGQKLPRNQSDDEAMGRFCKESVTTIWHYHGGCLVGKVVDNELRVKGIEALRVVDGSVFSLSPGTNPQATVMMLGRYTGLNILKQRSG